MSRLLSAASLVLLSSFASVTASAEVTLKAIIQFPRNHTFNVPFFAWIKEVNANGKGAVQVQFIGGPEAMPVMEQLNALQRGVTDIFFGSTSFFDGQVPETGALNASNKSAPELRAAGGQELLNKAFNAKANAQYLGYFGSGYTFHIYLKDDPKRTPSGGVNLQGLKIRGASIYRAFYDTQGATLAPVAPAEVFTALERGVIDGTGFPNLGLIDLGWEKLLKYRVFPTFWQGDISLIINADSWKNLDPKARELVQRTVINAEKSAHEFFKGEIRKEEAKLKAAGMKDVMQSPEDSKKYAAAAHGSLWTQLEKRLSKQEAAALRKTFYTE